MSDYEVIPLNGTPFDALNITVVTTASLDADVVVHTATSADHTTQIASSQLTAFATYAGFKGAMGATAHTFNDGKTVALLGLGDLGKKDHYPITKIGTGLATIVSASKAKKTIVNIVANLTTQEVRVAVEKFLFELYVDDRFRAEKKVPVATDIEFVLPAGADIASFANGVAEARAIARGTFLTRDLVNAPANYVHPPSMAKTLTELAAEVGLEATVLDRAECERRGMQSFIAVGKGSVHQPCLVHLTYKPTGTVTKKLVFIGKGVTFDTGGYNVKVAAMELMKMDMGGAAAVFGAAKTIAALKPANVEVHFISALAENMISSDSFRPGDILTASNGKTIEVLNTDAEGRLTMADALVYAEKNIAPDAIVEFSTLTGAQLVALGPKIAALMCKDETLCDEVKSCAKHAGENVWELPLFDEYKEGLKSKIADFTNLDMSRNAGTISAGIFLNEFVEKTPYAHLDIAGPVWNGAQGSATGYGVRLITALVEAYSKK